ncbi:MAG: 2'-5' RNA ligase [Gammaproteobacteria bacterium]|jgi:2'-5' RNA ligase
MPYSIELYFDTSFEQRIFNLWSVLENKSLPSKYSKLKIRPHLTLAVMDKCDETEVSDIVKYLNDGTSSFFVNFPAICTNSGESQFIFLLPIINKTLNKIRHQLVSKLIQSKNQPRKQYLLNNWLPHCTISKELSLDQSKQTMAICQDENICGITRIIEVGFVEFNPRRDILISRLN